MLARPLPYLILLLWAGLSLAACQQAPSPTGTPTRPAPPQPSAPAATTDGQTSPAPAVTVTPAPAWTPPPPTPTWPSRPVSDWSVDTWARSYGGPITDWVNDAALLADDGLIMIGTTTSFSADYHTDIWVAHLEADGQIRWQLRLGGNDRYDRGNAILPLAKGGFLLAGDTEPPGIGGSALLLVRLDGAGDILWQQTWPGSDDLSLRRPQLAQDGRGHIWLLENDFNGLRLRRLTAAGAVTGIWTWPGLLAGGMVGLPAGGVVVLGEWQPEPSERDLWLARLDADGERVWEQTIAAPLRQAAGDVALTADGGLVVAANTEYESIVLNSWLLKFDETGARQWTRAFRGAEHTTSGATAVTTTADGDIVVTGWSHYLERTVPWSSDHVSYAARFSPAGDLRWQRQWPWLGVNFAAETSDGYLLLAGAQDLSGIVVDGDSWLLRLNAAGNLGPCDPFTGAAIAFFNDDWQIAPAQQPVTIEALPSSAAISGGVRPRYELRLEILTLCP